VNEVAAWFCVKTVLATACVAVRAEFTVTVVVLLLELNEPVTPT
jgi:hypothetical protein